MAPRAAPALFLLLLLTACGHGPDPAAAAAAAKGAETQAADDLGRQFDSAFAAGNWSLARAQGDVLIMKYPKSPAATRIAAQYAEAKSKGEAQSEQLHLTSLWTYQDQPVGKRKQLSAAIYSKDRIDTGAGQSYVRLIFRDHPEWGRSSYLVLDSGDFNCYGGCKLKVTVDGKPRTLAGSRPKTDEAIAMFIEDERTMWRIAKTAKHVTIAVPIKAGGTRDAEFEFGGLDPSRMPGW